MDASGTAQRVCMHLGIVTLPLMLACGGDGGSDIGGPDETPPTISATNPANNATDVPVNAAVSATFSEAMDPATINTTTFVLNNGATGAVGYSGATATLTPSTNLRGGTVYTATITTGARDVAGNAVAQDHSWSFTTAADAVPAIDFPLADGKRWRYQGLDSTVVCASSTGCIKNKFSGEYFLHVEGQEQWQGRLAWRTTVYKLPQPADTDPELKVRLEHLFQGPDGLERWIETSAGGTWRTILSRRSASYGNSTFLLVDGPTHEDDMTLSASSTTVPAGSFTTVQALHEFTETGQFSPRDIFETRTEDYATGVGLVAGRWDYSFDDNDPSGTDIVSEGELTLTHIDNGPFPDLAPEQEPNDNSTQATNLSSVMIVRGGTAIADPGVILSDAEVGCTQQCIFPNRNGERRIQDWYRFQLTGQREIRVDLAFEAFSGGSFNDLDLYAFADPGSGPIFIGASLGEAGEPEGLFGTLQAGTFYLAVQAWDTPTGTVRYWLSIR
jgi:hypothetical protein